MNTPISMFWFAYTEPRASMSRVILSMTSLISVNFETALMPPPMKIRLRPELAAMASVAKGAVANCASTPPVSSVASASSWLPPCFQEHLQMLVNVE